MPITSIRYLKEENLKASRKIQNGYYRELIHSYGIDCIYFRKDVNFFNDGFTPSVNYTYGEETTAPFFISADVILYMSMDNDTNILNKFGIETDGDAQAFILIDDFSEQFRDLIGTERNATFNIPVTGMVSGGNISISADVISSYISGYVNYSDITTLSADVISGNINVPFVRYPNLYNEYIRSSEAYMDQVVSGALSGTYSGVVDLSGFGAVSGAISGTLGYHSAPAAKAGPNWQIAPQVGDFFKIQFKNGNREEYEVTNVTDRNLNSDGLNPLLSKYIWKMNLTRRDPSHEIYVESGNESTSGTVLEEFTVNKMNMANFVEAEADTTFDYKNTIIDKIDGTSSDNVYGSYGLGYGNAVAPQLPAIIIPNNPTPPSSGNINSFSTSQAIAGENLNIFKLVQYDQNGKFVLANNSTLTNIVGMTRNVININNIATVVTDGIITNPSWNLTPSSGVFLTTNGNFTQTMPNNNIHMFGIAISPTSIQINNEYDIII